MSVWQLLLVATVMLLGLFGVLAPGVPGTWLVWAAMLWWSLHERTDLAWILLASTTGLLLLTQVVVWQLPARRFRGWASPGGWWRTRGWARSWASCWSR